jgi:predicted DNA-binding protein
VYHVEEVMEYLPKETLKKLKSVSKKLCLPEEEIVRRSVETYIQKLEDVAAELEPIGFGMWKDRSEMRNSSKWVAELREHEWKRWSS